MRSQQDKKPSSWPERFSGWLLPGAVILPVLVSVTGIYFWKVGTGEGNAVVLPKSQTQSLSTDPATRPRQSIDARLLGILIHPTDARLSTATIISGNRPDTYLVGDSVAGGIVEKINMDHVVLRIDQEAVILALSAQPVQTTPSKVDHKANLELLRQSRRGYIQESEPTFKDEPLQPPRGNAAFREALVKAREASKQQQ